MNKQNNDWRERLNKGTENFEKLTNVNIMAGYYSWIESFISNLLKEQRNSFESLLWKSHKDEINQKNIEFNEVLDLIIFRLRRKYELEN